MTKKENDWKTKMTKKRKWLKKRTWLRTKMTKKRKWLKTKMTKNRKWLKNENDQKRKWLKTKMTKKRKWLKEWKWYKTKMINTKITKKPKMTEMRLFLRFWKTVNNQVQNQLNNWRSVWDLQTMHIWASLHIPLKASLKLLLGEFVLESLPSLLPLQKISFFTSG